MEVKGWKNNNATRWCDGSVGKLLHCSCRRAKLILLRIIRLNGLRLDDDSGVATGERTALGGDGARHIARGESQCHGNSRGHSQCQVLDRLDKALFLSV